MYKLLLCWRYLRTRWIALASIVSVTLGVATMIVVNGVMQGFTTEMQQRIHGILSDLIVEARSLDGMPDAGLAEEIRRVAGDDVAGVSATAWVPALLNFQCGSHVFTQEVRLIGVDEETLGNVSDFCKFLQHPANREAMQFKLREGGYDTFDHQAVEEAVERPQMALAGWGHRREVARIKKLEQEIAASRQPETPISPAPMDDPFAKEQLDRQNLFDPGKTEHTGVVLGIAIASRRSAEGQDEFFVVPGDDVKISTIRVGMPPKDTSDNFTVVDFYESKMSEYDSRFVFVPIRKLQEMRGMIDPTTGMTMINSLQIRLRPGADDVAVRDRLREALDPRVCVVETWRDKQSPLLAAVHMETLILNLLLFLIIAVAGFGILAIFYMIVVEKTRDIGILKSLGASGRGVMGIFLAYGLSLGLVGSGAGLAIGLLIVHHINQIAAAIGWIRGEPVFDPSIYYFYKIPAIVEPMTVAWIVAGALAIATAASILPARRAARLHPVEALRYE